MVVAEFNLIVAPTDVLVIDEVLVVRSSAVFETVVLYLLVVVLLNGIGNAVAAVALDPHKIQTVSSTRTSLEPLAAPTVLVSAGLVFIRVRGVIVTAAELHVDKLALDIVG